MSPFIYHVTVKGHQDSFQFFTFINSGAMNILVDMSWCVFTHSSTGIYIRMKNLTYSCHLFVCTHNFFLWIFFLSTFVIPIEISLFNFIISLVRMMDREAWGTTFHVVTKSWTWLSMHTHTQRKESPFYVITNFHFYMSHSKINFYQFGTFSLSLPPNTHRHTNTHTHTQYPHLYHLILYWANWNF